MSNLNVARDEPSSYDEIYSAHYRQVLRLCRLLLADDHEAEEVAQEVFLKMYRLYQTKEPAQAIAWGPWLTRVSVNACHDRRRSGWWKWWLGRKNEEPEVDHPSSDQTPEEAIVSRETVRRIWDACGELSARQREVFVLRFVEEWSTEEVAETLGLTTGSVKAHLFRAVHRLRRVLGGDL